MNIVEILTALNNRELKNEQILRTMNNNYDDIVILNHLLYFYTDEYEEYTTELITQDDILNLMEDNVLYIKNKNLS